MERQLRQKSKQQCHIYVSALVKVYLNVLVNVYVNVCVNVHSCVHPSTYSNVTETSA